MKREPFNPAAHDHLISVGYDHMQQVVLDQYRDGVGEIVWIHRDGLAIVITEQEQYSFPSYGKWRHD